MNTVYDRKYQNLALDIAKESGYESFIRQGCYCMFSGPTYETIAELRLAAAVSYFYWSKKNFNMNFCGQNFQLDIISTTKNIFVNFF